MGGRRIPPTGQKFCLKDYDDYQEVTDNSAKQRLAPQLPGFLYLIQITESLFPYIQFKVAY